MNEDGSVEAQMRSERRGRPGGEAKAYDVKIAQLSKCLRDDSPPLPSPSAASLCTSSKTSQSSGEAASYCAEWDGRQQRVHLHSDAVAAVALPSSPSSS